MTDEIPELDYRLLRSETGRRLYRQIYGKDIPQNNTSTINRPPDIPPSPRKYAPKPLEFPVKEESKYQPSLTKLVDFFYDQKVVDEEQTCILATLAAVYGLHIGIEGPAGSGKSHIVKAMLPLLPKEQVYVLSLATDKAIFYDADRVNKAKFIIAPELQKPVKDRNGSTIEVLKDLGEGKNVERIVTKPNGQVFHQVINSKGKVVIYTLATENLFKKDAELGRRFVALYTDTSGQHIQNVLEAGAVHRLQGEQKRNLSLEETKSLQDYVSYLIMLQGLEFRDPFAPFMRQYIPQIPRAVSFVNHYDNFLNAMAKFHSNSRLRKGRSVFLSLEDHFLLFNLYHENFLENLSAISGEGEKEAIRKVERNVDWQACLQSGVQMMQQYYPDLTLSWLEHQLQEGTVSVVHPIIREKIEIAGAPCL